MGISARAQFTPRSALGQFVQTVVTPGVIASVTAASQQMAQLAQGYAPVDTGALRDSIQSEVNDTGKTVVGTVTAGVRYAAYVEFGTGRRGSESPGAGPGPYKLSWPGMSAQPYLRPAMDEMRGLVLDLFRANISIGM